MTGESAIPPAELLAQLPWLRALSRRLAGEQAEDVTQEACKLALERSRPLGAVPLRAWLAGGARRVALDG
ncbi:MAG: sigma factor, partial [Planctomycetota bacterium]|nr:sigma factor [Planctomycetota bacterium]